MVNIKLNPGLCM